MIGELDPELKAALTTLVNAEMVLRLRQYTMRWSSSRSYGADYLTIGFHRIPVQDVYAALGIPYEKDAPRP